MVERNSKATPLSFIVNGLSFSVKRERIDKVLTRLEGLPSRSQVKEWFDQGRVSKGGKPLSPSDKVENGDVILIDIPPPRSLSLKPVEMTFKIFFEDEDLIVLYKPRGLSVHPGAGRSDEPTLVHGLLGSAQSLSSVGGLIRPGIVHRLDKNTEGILVCAKNDFIHSELSRQFADRDVERAYWALVYGRFPSAMTVDEPIGRHRINRKKMAVSANGRPSITHAKLLKYFDEGYSWIQCILGTGRTHQIRVHLSHRGFPVLGDPEYSRPRKFCWSDEKQAALNELKGQALIAFRLGFVHPRTGHRIFFESEKPQWLKTLIQE